MRINTYLAQASGLSRRAADAAISAGRVRLNQATAELGSDVQPSDHVFLDNQLLTPVATTTIMLHKPVGYVVSRNGQGSQTIYDLLPPELQHLNPVGRLDKDSSGVLLLTNDGQLANQLTHPSYRKLKIYQVTLNAPLQPLHQQIINDTGIQLDDGNSQLQLHKVSDDARSWEITMFEGRNRQIRRTFAALGYTVSTLHRTQFGDYALHDLGVGDFSLIDG